ncbi:MAG: globin domain-containing protein [Planctomycetota bacterium]|jgi:hemoglobin
MDLDLYSELGEEGIASVTRHFYARVRTDDLLAPMYPADDWDGAEARLRDFLVGRFGGPQRYVEQRGHPRLRMRHARFVLDQAARDRWVEHMDAAIDASDIPEGAAERMRAFLSDTATFLMNR